MKYIFVFILFVNSVFGQETSFSKNHKGILGFEPMVSFSSFKDTNQDRNYRKVRIGASPYISVRLFSDGYLGFRTEFRKTLYSNYNFEEDSNNYGIGVFFKYYIRLKPKKGIFRISTELLYSRLNYEYINKVITIYRTLKVDNIRFLLGGNLKLSENFYLYYALGPELYRWETSDIRKTFGFEYKF